MRTTGFSIEVITLPVSDVNRATRLYVDQVGFTLDVDYSPKDTFRVAQLTPPGSGCSIQVGKQLTDAPAGSVRNIYLVVSDIEAARRFLLERGVEVSAAHGGTGATDDRIDASFHIVIHCGPIADTDAHGSAALRDCASTIADCRI